jgi:murein DD-endopeptidase MepM/ murein hydrolase activator NlpD
LENNPFPLRILRASRRAAVAGAVLVLAASSLWAKGRAPAARFTVQPSTVTAGRTLAVWLETPDAVKAATLVFQKAEARFFPMAENRWRALIGISSLESPGPKTAQAVVQGRRGKPARRAVSFSVQAGTYPVSHVHLTPEKERLLELMERDGEVLAKIYRKPGISEKLWSGTFILPATGVVSSVFGARRSYTGRNWLSPHSGTDIANSTGTPVVAPGRGRVVYRDRLESFGNVVMLDHGHGVFSYYLHMLEISAKKGDLVDKGAPLGLMGQEGVATGPHVHWSLAVAGERVDPLEWTVTEFP